MTEANGAGSVLLLRSGNPRRLTGLVWSRLVRLCADAGVRVLATEPEPAYGTLPGERRDETRGVVFVPEDIPVSGLTDLLRLHSPDAVVHCADPDALVRRDVHALAGYWRARGDEERGRALLGSHELLLDKARTRELCAAVGVPVPDGVSGRAGDRAFRDAAAEVVRRAGRAVAKDALGWAGRGQATVADEDGLLRFLRTQDDDATMVVEAFVSGEEISVEVVLGAGTDVVGWSVKGRTGDGGHPLHRVRYAPPGPVPAVLAATAVTLCREAGLAGVAELEFVVDTDPGGAGLRLLECNPRVSATSRMFTVANGCSSTEIALARAIDPGAPVNLARTGCVEVPLPLDLPAGALDELAATAGVAWLHPSTDGYQPRLFAGGGDPSAILDGLAAVQWRTGLPVLEQFAHRRDAAAAVIGRLSPEPAPQPLG